MAKDEDIIKQLQVDKARRAESAYNGYLKEKLEYARGTVLDAFLEMDLYDDKALNDLRFLRMQYDAIQHIAIQIERDIESGKLSEM